MYLGEATLPGCLERLRAQRLRDWECIGIDDASPDRCAEIFDEAARRDRRLRLVRHTHNQGVAAARATGLAHATGAALHLLDQDDHLAADGVLRLWECLRARPSAPAVYGDYALVDTRTGRCQVFDRFPEVLDFEDLLQGPPFCPLVVLHRRDHVVRAGGFTAGFDSCDDWDLWARLARLGAPFQHHRVLVGEWRVHEANNSRKALTSLASGLKVLQAMHTADPRVTQPDPRWRDGAPSSERVRWALRLFWLQVANCLAQRDVPGALVLTEAFEASIGRGQIPPESAVEIHPAMVFSRLLAGDDPRTYPLDLQDVLCAFFTEFEVRRGSPGFARAAGAVLRDRQLATLLEENDRLSALVERYRSSRSYRLGRFLTRLVRWRD